ncbi:hypothetical protein MY11210_003039 [Beauveria gryllotalpidicola]
MSLEISACPGTTPFASSTRGHTLSTNLSPSPSSSSSSSSLVAGTSSSPGTVLPTPTTTASSTSGLARKRSSNGTPSTFIIPVLSAIKSPSLHANVHVSRRRSSPGKLHRNTNLMQRRVARHRIQHDVRPQHRQNLDVIPLRVPARAPHGRGKVARRFRAPEGRADVDAVLDQICAQLVGRPRADTPGPRGVRAMSPTLYGGAGKNAGRAASSASISASAVDSSGQMSMT